MNDWRDILGYPDNDRDWRLLMERDARDMGEEDEDDDAGHE